jgi:radical SAM/Cys-rich protein
MNRFDLLLENHDLGPLRAESIDSLQVNLGRVCNQTCVHCHQDAGPNRTESMSSDIIDMVLHALARHHIATLDVTGGVPELHPGLRRLITGARDCGASITLRCNLTALLLPGLNGLAGFLRDNWVGVIASLPCYTSENVDAIRGDGVFARSIEALKLLNSLEYGFSSDLRLDLVYSPKSPTLPGPAQDLEDDYRRELASLEVSFDHLITMANSPVGRFGSMLRATGELDSYISYLADQFSPQTVPLVMCRRAVSVGWDGRLYDCDFNLALNKPVNCSSSRRLSDFDYDTLRQRRIVTGDHCLACTAGAGSSCAGALVSDAESVTA